MSTLRPTNFKPTFIHIHNRQSSTRTRQETMTSKIPNQTTNQPTTKSRMFFQYFYRLAISRVFCYTFVLFIEQINTNNWKLQCNANCEPTRTITIYPKIEEMNSFKKWDWTKPIIIFQKLAFSTSANFLTNRNTWHLPL